MFARILFLAFALFNHPAIDAQLERNRNPFCVPDNAIIPGDGIDNDCDGLVDEEYCYNGIDEDGDGLFNEDCASLDVCLPRASTKGLEFVGAFMENKPDRPVYNKLEVVITRTDDAGVSASPIAAKVVTPLLNQNIDVSPDEIANISVVLSQYDSATKLYLSDTLRVLGSGIAMKGFYVRANASVTVHGYNKEFFTSDSFLQFPADSLGTEYYAVTHEPSIAMSPEMAVVALYSDTIVSVTLLANTGDTDINRIQLEWDGRTYTNGDTLTVRLEPFQVAQFQTDFDLTGTKVTSNYPVAFYSGNRRTWIRDDATETFVRSRDHLVEQIPPTNTWGRRFVTQNYPPHTGDDHIRVIASQDDTIVQTITTDLSSSDEKSSRFTLIRAGTAYQILLKPNTFISLYSSKPIMVAQLTHSQMGDSVPADELTDPSLIYVVPVEQYDGSYIFATTEYVGDGNFTHYVTLTTKQGNEDEIYLDGRPVYSLPQPAVWEPITIRGNRSLGERSVVSYMQGYVKVQPGVHRLKSDFGTFMAVQWAVGDRNTIAQPLGIRWRQDECMNCQQIICGDQVDNDCDGQIDEEICDGFDNDFDGAIDEDCDCQAVPTTPEPTTIPTTVKPVAPEGDCTLPSVPMPCIDGSDGIDTQSLVGKIPGPRANKINIIFVIDWTTSLMPTRNEFQQSKNFLKETVTTWFTDSDIKFGFISFDNGVPKFLQYLTDDREAARQSIDNLYRYNIITNPRSDMTAALRFVRSHMFSPNVGADENAKNLVVVLAFGQYSRPSEIASSRWEATRLDLAVNASTRHIGRADSRDVIVRMALSPRNVFDIDSFDDLQGLADPESRLVQSLEIVEVVDPVTVAPSTCARESPFKSTQTCFGNSLLLACPPGRVITIVSANYGRINYHNEETCGRRNGLACDAANPACSYVDAYDLVASTCNLRPICDFAVDSQIMARQLADLMPTCDRSSTYLDINYFCAESPSITSCSFSPASRLLSPANQFTLSASSSASCSSSCEESSDGTCDATHYCPSLIDQCRPELATFDKSATQAWCPSLGDTRRPWLMADLGAPYTILGVVLQGRRRYLEQYTTRVSVRISNDNVIFSQVQTEQPRAQFDTNTNSIESVMIYFESTENVARYVRVAVVNSAEHPALHFEVLIHNQVHGCKAFQGRNTDLFEKRGTKNQAVEVTCTDGTQTASGDTYYYTRCDEQGYWTREESCF